MYNVVAINSKGKFRNINNDYVLVNEQIIQDNFINIESERIVAVVCDGVGEYDGSSDAARIALEDIKENGINCIEEDMKRIEKRILENKTKKKLKESLTTIAGIVGNGSELLVFNIGDTKIYKIVTDYIEQVSNDDSLYIIYKSLGLKQEEKTKNTITNCLGINGASVHYSQIGDLKDNEVLMICSDGMSNDMNYKDVISIINGREQSLFNKAINLTEIVKSQNNKDNLSVILIRKCIQRNSRLVK